MSWIAQLPFGRGRRWMTDGALNAIFGGWQLSGIVQGQSGGPFTVTIPNPTKFLGVTTSNWRPDVVGDWRPDDPGPEQWMRRDAFVVPRNPDGTYRFGNLGRNVLIGPRYFNIDAGLMKDFPLGRDRRLQFRWEVFNATNHPSYGLPVSLLSPDFENPDFGKIRSTVSAPRQMQFGVKFVF